MNKNKHRLDTRIGLAKHLWNAGWRICDIGETINVWYRNPYWGARNDWKTE